jgi:DNA-binding MarR family transcriptional regulator
MPNNGSRAFRGFITLLQSQKGWLHDRVADPSMREFAERMFCDASNATGLVDRLERRGLAERRASDSDRRAKVVHMTPAGARLFKKIEDSVWADAPPAIARLSAADQRILREIIERALDNVD